MAFKVEICGLYSLSNPTVYFNTNMFNIISISIGAKDNEVCFAYIEG